MSDKPHIKIVKREDRPKPDERGVYVRRHKDSLLRLLIEEDPDRAQLIINNIRRSMKAAA